jgi:hypothetical protein
MKLPKKKRKFQLNDSVSNIFSLLLSSERFVSWCEVCRKILLLLLDHTPFVVAWDGSVTLNNKKQRSKGHKQEVVKKVWFW